MTNYLSWLQETKTSLNCYILFNLKNICHITWTLEIVFTDLSAKKMMSTISDELLVKF